MHCLTIPKRAAAGLAVAAVLLSSSRGIADHRRRYYPPPVGYYVLAPAPAPYPRYFRPISGTYGTPIYAIETRRYAGYSPRYFGGSEGPPPGATYGYGAPRYGSPNYPSPAYGSPVTGDPSDHSFPPTMPTIEPYSNPVLHGTMLENQQRWGVGLPPGIPTGGARPRPRPSSPQQQMKSIHAQAHGDVWLRKLKFLNAYERYKEAINAASDRPEPYFRIGFALAAVGSLDSAVKYIKQGLDLDPQWPSHGERLDTIFGDDNRLAVLSLTERVASWVREDVRDPDRIFLMGVLLHFDGDARANQFFEAAYRLAGFGDHLLAFLQPSIPQETVPPNQPATSPFAGAPAPRQPNGPPAAIEPPMSSDQNPPRSWPQNRDNPWSSPRARGDVPQLNRPPAPRTPPEPAPGYPRSFFDSQPGGAPGAPDRPSPASPSPDRWNPNVQDPNRQPTLQTIPQAPSAPQSGTTPPPQSAPQPPYTPPRNLAPPNPPRQNPAPATKPALPMPALPVPPLPNADDSASNTAPTEQPQLQSGPILKVPPATGSDTVQTP